MTMYSMMMIALEALHKYSLTLLVKLMVRGEYGQRDLESA